MTRLMKLIATAGLLTAATAQSYATSVTQVFLPFADQQPLVASVVAQSGDVKTLAIQCVPGTDSSDCGFPEPITITAGPSTLHVNPSGIYQIVGEYDCKITGSSIAACALTEGLYSTESDGEYITTSAASSSITRATVSGADVSFIAVTITAGAVASATATSSGAGVRTTSASGSRSGASGTASSSSSPAPASATGNGAAQISGVAALLLAAPLLLL